VVLETKGVGDLFPTSALHYCSYALIVHQGRTNVPSIGGMEAPGFALHRFEIDKDFCSQWSHGDSIEGKRDFHGLKGRECRILTAWAQHVHGVIALVCEAAPVYYWKGFGEAHNPGGKVVLPRPNRPLGRVCTMYVQRCILEGGLL
jgi:hypothetical protein